MKCLMIKPEWASDIIGGEKTIEYRSWHTDYRGDFFIGCCSTSVSKSFLCGVAELSDITYNEQEKVYEWHLTNVRAIKPIPVKGQLRLFECGVDEYEIINDKDADQVYEEAMSWIQK